MKTKSTSKSFFNRSVLIPLVTVAMALTQSSALADPDADAIGSRNSGLPANFQFDYMHTQAEWEILKEHSQPLRIPLDGPSLSRQQRNAFAQLKRMQREAPQLQPPSNWTNIGPAPITSTACQYGAQNSGRIVSLAIDPTNSSHWLIGAAAGGIWQTTDAGATWSPRTDDQSSMQTDAIAFAPGNSNIAYASLPLTGLLKSTNGGSTWSLIEASVFGGRGARAFAISPSDPNVVVAAVETSFFPDSAYGIYRTTNGGLNWTQKLSQSASALVSVPGDFKKQYAAIGQPYGGVGSNGLFRSTNAGQSWQPIPGPWGTGSNVGMFSLALSPSQPAVLYVWGQVYDQATQTWLGHIWKSTNAWNQTPSWTLLPYPDPSDPTKFGRALSVDPANPDDLYAGEVDIWKYHNGQWMKITGCPPNGTHIDFWEIKWVGGDLLVTNDGGIFRSPDQGSTYQSRNGNLSITQFYWAALHPSNLSFALAGCQDNGTVKYSGSASWQQVWLGDGMSPVISVVRPDTNWLVSSCCLGIWRTRNGGSLEEVDQTIDHTCAPFFLRIVGCPSSDAVLVGTTKLWRSDDVLSADQYSWNTNSPDLGCNNVRSIAFAKSDTSCGTYAFGGPGGVIWATTNAGVSWSQVGPGTQLPTRTVTYLAFDPQDRKKLYATFSGTSEGDPVRRHVYVCKDITAATPAWGDISPPINTSHNAIAIDPNHTAYLYVGTDLGVLTSTDGGGNWSAVPSSQIPPVPIWDIEISPAPSQFGTEIFVFTYGRGAYVGTDSGTGASGNLSQSSREPEYATGKLLTSAQQPWWFGVGIVGTVVVTGSYIRRRRKHSGAGAITLDTQNAKHESD